MPDGLVAFSSAQGKALFREALAAGTMEGFFSLSEQFHTQAEPAYCALGSLVVALNALAIDPGRLWKGPWRWFDESLLDCCVPLDVVAKRGVTLTELACLAECNGAKATLARAPSGVGALREEIIQAARAGDRVVIVGYDRSVLGQTGSGHYSPIGGYHPATDRALLLDVARFKYPPHWVPLERLFRAIATTDSATGKPRGWVTLERSEAPRPLFVRLGVSITGWRGILDALTREVAESGAAPTAEAFAAALVRLEPAREGLLAPLATAMDANLAEQHRAYVDALVEEVRCSAAFRAARAALDELAGGGVGPLAGGLSAEVAATLALVLAERPEAELGPTLRVEITAVRKQLDALCSTDQRSTDPRSTDQRSIEPRPSGE